MAAGESAESNKTRAIALLLDGMPPYGVSKELDIPENTVIYWRTQHKKEHGTEFPSHRGGNSVKEESYEHFKNQSFKYTDEEIFALVRLNRGYGIDNFVKKTYPSKKNQTKLKYRFIQMFSDWKKESGEDLYEVIQDPDFVEMVTEYEYRRITGRKQVPKGFGRATGGRVNNKTRRIRGGASQIRVPLQPQIFHWGDHRRPDERDWRYSENSYTSEIDDLLTDLDTNAVDLLSIFRNPWSDASKLFGLFQSGELELWDPGPYLFLPAAKTVEWFLRAIFLPMDQFKHRDFHPSRAQKVIDKVIKGKIKLEDASYVSGRDPDIVVKAGGDIWNRFLERVSESNLLDSWKKIDRATSRIYHRAGEYRHCTMKPFKEIVEEFQYVSNQMKSFISGVAEVFPEIVDYSEA